MGAAMLAAAIAQFAAAWRRYRDADPTGARAREQLGAVGYAGNTPAELERWLYATHPVGERAATDALRAVIDAVERQPEDSPLLRATPADLAPYLGLAAGDAPAVILHMLTAHLEARPR